jgi:hypothetical protein
MVSKQVLDILRGGDVPTILAQLEDVALQRAADLGVPLMAGDTLTVYVSGIDLTPDTEKLLALLKPTNPTEFYAALGVLIALITLMAFLGLIPTREDTPDQPTPIVIQNFDQHVEIGPTIQNLIIPVEDPDKSNNRGEEQQPRP